MDEVTNRKPELLPALSSGARAQTPAIIRAAGRKVLLDSGLFQGLKELRLRNWREPPFAPSDIDAVNLSHGHIDHSGYLPLLTRRDFRGPVYCTPATRSLLRIMLPDAAHIPEEEAAYANRKFIRAELGWNTEVAEDSRIVELEPGTT